MAHGFQQDDGKNIYAPVARMTPLKMLLSVMCSKGYIIHQLDVITAFLNSPVNSEVYVRQLEGFEKDFNIINN